MRRRDVMNDPPGGFDATDVFDDDADGLVQPGTTDRYAASRCRLFVVVLFFWHRISFTTIVPGVLVAHLSY